MFAKFPENIREEELFCVKPQVTSQKLYQKRFLHVFIPRIFVDFLRAAIFQKTFKELFDFYP